MRIGRCQGPLGQLGGRGLRRRRRDGLLRRSRPRSRRRATLFSCRQADRTTDVNSPPSMPKPSSPLRSPSKNPWTTPGICAVTPPFESLGLGTCYIGAIRNNPETVARELALPEGVFPVFGLTVGFPDPAQPSGVKP